MVRRFPIMVPLISVTTSSRSCRDVALVNTVGSLPKYMIAPSTYAIADPILDRRITVCFLLWSMMFQNCTAVSMFAAAKNPPMIELIMSELVCKNAQKTKQNRIKKLVT